MTMTAILAPFLGALLTLMRGCTLPGAMPKFLDKWLLVVTDEPRWTLQRGWNVLLIGVWPAYVVWSLIGALPVPTWILAVVAHRDINAFFLPIGIAAWTWCGAALAFTLGHGQYHNYPDGKLFRDVLGMAMTGGAMSIFGAITLAIYGLWLPMALFLLGGLLKAAAYAIGWTGIGERIDDWWAPTRLAELVQGFFLYAGVSAALLVGGR